MEKVKLHFPVILFCLFLMCIQDVKSQFFGIKKDSSGITTTFSEPENKETDIREDIIRVARKYLGIRYCSSGKNPKAGFDCSGFTGFVFRKLGINLKSSSPAQAAEGKKVPFYSARKGDLAFFGRRGKKGKYRINHAAIVISEPGQPLSIIHSASGKGIVITRVNEDPYWRKSLIFVKSVL